MNDAFGQPQTVMVLGGTSDIAESLIRKFAVGRCRTLVLLARDADRLAAAASEARALGVESVLTIEFDAREGENADKTIAMAFDKVGTVDLVLLAVGALGEQQVDEYDAHRVAEMAAVNYLWPIAALTAVAGRLRTQGNGQIVVLSSVAGVRVRRSNFIYGSAKAGLDAFAMGLGESLRGSGVRVQVVRPGFVHSKMTNGLSPAPFATSPDSVASAVIRGLETGAAVVWVPVGLRWLFSLMRVLPQSIWRRLPG